MEGIMKKAICLSFGLVLLFVTVVFILPSYSADVLNACAKIKNGQLRIVTDPSQCKKSEHSVVLNGSVPAVNPVPAFAGKVCWNYNQTEDETGSVSAGPFLMTAYVTYLGDERYSIQSITVIDGKVMVSNGSAMIVGDSIYVATASSTQQTVTDDDRNVHIDQLKLSTTSLDGTYWAVTNTFIPSGRTFGHFYTAGNFTMVNCP